MGTHVVRQGETLSAIAHRFHTTARILARMNGIQDPNRVAIGRRLEVPGPRDPQPAAARSTAQQPQPSRTGARAQTDTPAPQTPSVTQAGDVTVAQIQAIMPNAGTHADDYQAALNTAMRAHGITTWQQQAAFLAQISVESGQLRQTVENMNYTTVARLRTVWPRRFPTDEAARPYVRNPEGLGNFVYANRNGNGDGESGDGYRFRGRGLMQTTGRSNYRAAGYEDRPEALGEPDTAADSAATFWEDNGLNGRTEGEIDRRAFDGVTGTINAGRREADLRWQAYQRALTALRPAPAQ